MGRAVPPRRRQRPLPLPPLWLCCLLVLAALTAPCDAQTSEETKRKVQLKGKAAMDSLAERMTSRAKDAKSAMDRWHHNSEAWKDAHKSCHDADAYVRSAMGGRDCATVAAAGDCETIRALGEPNQVCGCSCLPADRAVMPPASILGSTGFVMRDLKTLLRGVAAKACLIGPQIHRQSKGLDGFEALPECAKLSEHDFDTVPHFLAPRVPQGRLPLGCTHRGPGASGAFGSSSAGYQGLHPAAGAVVRLMDSQRNLLLIEGGALAAAQTAADVGDVELEVYMAREGQLLSREPGAVSADSSAAAAAAATAAAGDSEESTAQLGAASALAGWFGSSSSGGGGGGGGAGGGGGGELAGIASEDLPAGERPNCSEGHFFHRRTVAPRER